MSTLRLLSLAVALALASTVSAQSPPDPATSSSQDTFEGRGGSSETGISQADAPVTREAALMPSATGATDSVSSALRTAMGSQADKHRLSKIIGKNVQTATGDVIGEVKDVIVDNDGRLTHALVSYGGALGVGNKLAAIPWQTVISMVHGDRIVLEKSRLESAPSFKDTDTPNFSMSGWSLDADKYWTSVTATPNTTGSTPSVPSATPRKQRG